MSTPLHRPQSAPLRFIANRLALPVLSVVARQPGMVDAFRLTILYHDGRWPNQVATVTRRNTALTAHVQVAYLRDTAKPINLDYNIELTRFQTVVIGIRKLGFDQLDDMANIPWFGADLWLVERAASVFHHDLIIQPELARDAYREMVSLITTHLPETVRTIQSS